MDYVLYHFSAHQWGLKEVNTLSECHWLFLHNQTFYEIRECNEECCLSTSGAARSRANFTVQGSATQRSIIIHTVITVSSHTAFYNKIHTCTHIYTHTTVIRTGRGTYLLTYSSRCAAHISGHHTHTHTHFLAGLEKLMWASYQLPVPKLTALSYII